MTGSLYLLHDRPGDDEPDYLEALAAVENVIALRWGEVARPHRIVDHPWLIDFAEIDHAKTAFLHLSLTRTGGAPRLFVANTNDEGLLARIRGFGTTRIASPPIDVAGIGRILHDHHAARRDDTTRRTAVNPLGLEAVAGATAVLERVFEACIGGLTIDEEFLADVASAVLPAIREIGLDSWLEIVRDHHTGTYQHSLITMGVAVGFGRALGLDRETVHRLALAGLLHDVGKFWVPEEILSKPGKLGPEELEIVRRHSRDGWAVLRASGLPLGEDVFDAILHHHEYLDGSGYPDGLRAEQISTLTRILTIADIYGALAETRSYRPALKPREIRPILQAMADRGRIDAKLLRALPLVRST